MAIKKWCLKRHPRKGFGWIKRKYFKRVGMDNWRFVCSTTGKDGDKKPLYLRKAAATHIRRHRKIIGEATPFDPKYMEYFKQRARDCKASVTSNTAKHAGLRIVQPYAGLSVVR